MFNIKIKKSSLIVSSKEPIAAGASKVYHVSFDFDKEWEGLSKNVVFKAGETSISVLLEGNFCVIPWEVLSKENVGEKLWVGVHGSGSDGTKLPTVWNELEVIQAGAELCGSGSEPTPTAVSLIYEAAKNAEDMAERAVEEASEARVHADRAEKAKEEAEEYLLQYTSLANDVVRIGNELSGAVEEATSSAASAKESEEKALEYLEEASKSKEQAERAEIIAKEAQSEAEKAKNESKQFAAMLDEAIAPTAIKGDGKDSIVFNKNSKSLSPRSQSGGSDTVAGGKAFKIIAVSDNGDGTGTYTLSSVTWLEVGMRYSAVLNTANYNAGKITNITGNVVTVDGYKDIALNTNTDNPDEFNVYNFFMIVDRPDLGDTDVGFNAHAEGEDTIASNNASHAEGRGTKAVGKFSHTEGLNTIAGHSCHAEGAETQALGDSSHAEGHKAKAFGNNSHAEGFDTTASGHQSHAEGENTTASGYVSHAEGKGSIAGGYAAHAEGETTYAKGENSHAEGYKTQALGANNHAEGYHTKTNADASHAEGSQTEATGFAAHAEGNTTHATEESSHAEGFSTTAMGKYAHAEGNNTTASSQAAHAEGEGTQAVGWNSHAEGGNTIAQGVYSHAGGSNTEASNFQYAIGKFNNKKNGPTWYEDTTGTLFIVGNGTSEDNRTNAFRVDTDGRCYAGNSFIGSGADFAEFFEWSDKNLDAEDRRGLFVTLEGEKIRLANSGDDYIGIISSTDAFTGNAAFDEWHNKYVTDVFGKIQYKTIEVDEAVDEVTGETIPAHTITQPIINEAYDSTKEYISREHRKEWAIVGLLGQIVIVDDGTCVVGGYAAPSVGGIGTNSAKGYRVMKRIDETHVKVLVK